MSRPPLGRRRDPEVEEDPATGMGWLGRELIRFLLALPLLIGAFAGLLLVLSRLFGTAMPPGWVFLMAVGLAPIVWARIMVSWRWRPGNMLRWMAFSLAWLVAFLGVGIAFALLAMPTR